MWYFSLLYLGPARRRAAQIAGQIEKLSNLAGELPRSPVISKICPDLRIEQNAFRWPRVDVGLRFSERARQTMPISSVKSSFRELLRKTWKLLQNAFPWPRVDVGLRFSERARKTMPRSSVKSEIGEIWSRFVNVNQKCVSVASRGP